MTAPRRRVRGGARLPYHRLGAIALVLAATVPIAIMGVLFYNLVARSLATDAAARTNRAVDSTNALVTRSERDLEELALSYSAWPAFVTMVESGDVETIRTDVLEFLVEQGSVSAGIVTSDAGRVVAGPPRLTAALLGEVGRDAPSLRVVAFDGSVYLLDDDLVPGPAAGTDTVGHLLLVRQLDARFAADLGNLTGFAVGLADGQGTMAVATDPIVTEPELLAGDGTTIVRTNDIVGQRIPLGTGPGGPMLILASPVSALQSAAGSLPTLILGLLTFTAIEALLLAFLLSRILRHRLDAIHDGLIAVADGRVPPELATGSGDDIARLAAGLGRLVDTLDRREATLRACLAAAAAVPIHLSPVEAGERLAAATLEIFALAWCRVVAGDGLELGTAGTRPGDDEADADAPLGRGTDGRRLEVGLKGQAVWSDGDQASLEVMALLVGTVLDEAEAYGRAAGRADRLDRLNRLQREFLRSVSHNLRAPLATIELAATDLEEASADGYVHARAEAILLEERRLARLVNQVLILSRIETGTLQLDGEPVSLAPLVRRIARELGIEGQVDVTDNGRGAVAFTDPGATEQIAWILMDNATRYAPGSPIHVEITPGAGHTELGRELVLAFEDEGPGVPAGERRRIFQRFVRGSTGRSSDGTGLGLSVARGLARSLGGDVVYRPGAIGARFEVRLPSAGEDWPGDGDTAG